MEPAFEKSGVSIWIGTEVKWNCNLADSGPFMTHQENPQAASLDFAGNAAKLRKQGCCLKEARPDATPFDRDYALFLPGGAHNHTGKLSTVLL
jgi:hypothetical protein